MQRPPLTTGEARALLSIKERRTADKRACSGLHFAN
jgi:hypothetical protein